MLKLGIIGTHWITHKFITAAHESGQYEFAALYSRTEAQAQSFAGHYPDKTLRIDTDLDHFLRAPETEVIYIASPNSLHFTQAQAAILAGKHVICEKPAVTSLAELNKLIMLADQNNVFYFEAMRTIHEVNFQKVLSLLPHTSEILGAHFTFMKYSSRYDEFLEGLEPHVFSPVFAGGALMDLGVYLIYTAVALFGKPESSVYFARKLSTGVDGIGTIILRYPHFDVTLTTGKHANSFLPAEIYCQRKTIALDAIHGIGAITVHTVNGGKLECMPVDTIVPETFMIEEARNFAQVIRQQNIQAENYRYWLDLARIVHGILEKLRKENDITFPNDTE